jgi:hypothetical protein
MKKISLAEQWSKLVVKADSQNKSRINLSKEEIERLKNHTVRSNKTGC